MTARRILTVGLELASSDCQYASFHSNTSLLDYDIVLFKPQIDAFFASCEVFQGKLSLSEFRSFQLKECCEHWRRELKQAAETGKTVVIFLPTLAQVYVDTGQRSYSGTGRNQKTTRHVTLYDNYQAIPATIAPVATTGTSMKLASLGAECLAPYWAEFERYSSYKVLLTAEKVPASIVTRTGAKTVGAIYRSKSSSGSLVLLPDIDFYSSQFVREKGEKQTWTTAATQFSNRMVSAVVALDRALCASGEVTPEPAWAADSAFALGPERSLRADLLEAEQHLEEAQKRKESLIADLTNAALLRSLLFEKGKPLEHAIIEALRVLGFKAEPFKESGSEFDVVFEAEEGRLIGEAEGKDTKAINIDKLRQLAMNIHEDLQRDEVSTPAKAVLFGNAYRLQSLAERGDPFTEKCHSAAATSNTALVFTPDLFRVAQFLLDQQDEDFAKRCRQCLLTTTGRASLPETPQRSHADLAEAFA